MKWLKDIYKKKKEKSKKLYRAHLLHVNQFLKVLMFLFLKVVKNEEEGEYLNLIKR